MVRAAWAQVAMVVSLLELVGRVGVGWWFMWALLELGELIVEHREGRSEPVGGGDGELLARASSHAAGGAAIRAAPARESGCMERREGKWAREASEGAEPAVHHARRAGWRLHLTA